jgi:glycosyltransferase involved in cell wall biosynthesis
MKSNFVNRSYGPRVAFVSSYPPQLCGIATFTQDLATNLMEQGGPDSVSVISVSEAPHAYSYPDEVLLRIPKREAHAYRMAADFINAADVDVVCLQHEFGLFGGDEGGHILELMRSVGKPVVTALHTVLAEPDDRYRRRTIELIEASSAVVGLTPRAISLLCKVYNAPIEKIHLIPHGIPDFPFVDPELHKRRFGLAGRTVILTFGLIGPSKGIEDMIEAMPAIVAGHPDVVYMIVGATHPGVKAHQGEEYRMRLQARVAELGLEENVIFHDKYLEKDELYEYLQACDIYVTPYPNRDQISSGTLAYAAGMGRAVVSTKYWYACDLLGDDRGRLVDFRSPDELAEAINGLIENEDERIALGRRAHEFCRRMTWSNVAADYRSLFEDLRQPSRTRLFTRQSSQVRTTVPAGEPRLFWHSVHGGARQVS